MPMTQSIVSACSELSLNPIDVDGSGKLDEEEFKSGEINMAKFQSNDVDGDGKLSR